MIIYGPGTQHSSLFPSYMTEGVAEAIAANKSADKIFVGNIHRDYDIQTDDANDLARKLLGRSAGTGRRRSTGSSRLALLRAGHRRKHAQPRQVRAVRRNPAFPSRWRR